MTAPIAANLKLKVVCTDLPGKRFADVKYSGNVYDPVHLGIQRGKEVIEIVPGDSRSAIFTPDFTVTRKPNGKPNFTGHYAQGTPDERFFYLSWGVQKKKGEFAMFRRLKIYLTGLSWARVQKSLKTGKPIEVHLNLTGSRNDPLCARPPKQNIAWK